MDGLTSGRLAAARPTAAALVRVWSTLARVLPLCDCRVPVEDAARFRVEVLFSPGAAHNPLEVVPLKQDHTLPVAPRMALHRGAGDFGSGTTWARLSSLLTPHATPAKASTYTYSMV